MRERERERERERGRGREGEGERRREVERGGERGERGEGTQGEAVAISSHVVCTYFWHFCWVAFWKHLDKGDSVRVARSLCDKLWLVAFAASSQVELFEKRLSFCSGVAHARMVLWKFRKLPRLKVSQDLRGSLTETLEPMFRRCVDQIPTAQDVEESAEAVHFTIEQIVEGRDEVARVFPQEGQEQIVQVVKVLGVCFVTSLQVRKERWGRIGPSFFS